MFTVMTWRKSAATLRPMAKHKKLLKRAERFRVNMAVTIGALVLIVTLSLKYPLAFLGLLIFGLAYAIYRIVKDRKNRSTGDLKRS